MEGCLIAGISGTHEGAPDGQELPGLIEKVQETGIEVTEVIGHMSAKIIWKPAAKGSN